MSGNNSNLILGPLIPASISSKTNYTRELETDTILSTVVTDGTATMSGDRVMNLLDPVQNQDVSTKNYADTVLKVVSDTLESIQYNSGSNNFGGSSNLTYSLATGTLFSNNTIVGDVLVTTSSLFISSGNVSNAYDPVSSTKTSSAVTKNFIDRYISITTSTENSLSMTYTPEQMTNVFLNRNPASNTTDTTCDATNLNAYIKSTISSLNGTNCRFAIYNSHSSSKLTVSAGSGISFVPTCSNLIVYPNYKMTCTINVTSGTSTNLLIDNLSYTKTNDNFVVGPRSLYVTSAVTRVSDTFRFNTSFIEYTVPNVVYAPSDCLNIIERNFTGAKTDTFGDINVFIQSYYTINSPIYNIYKTGAIELVIKNTSVSGNLTLVQDIGQHWMMDPNSNMIIGPGKTGYFYLYVDTVAKTGNVYVIGIV